jgi:hypothetical protein
MTRLQFTRVLGLSAMFLMAACSSPQAPPNPAESSALLPGDTPVAHPVHSVDLLAAMAELEKLTLDELSANLESDTMREARLDEVERISAALASSAATLPSMLYSLDLPADEAVRFRELADQLGSDAVSLRDRAASGNLETAKDEREVLLATCNACHAEFRVMPPASGSE